MQLHASEGFNIDATEIPRTLLHWLAAETLEMVNDNAAEGPRFSTLRYGGQGCENHVYGADITTNKRILLVVAQLPSNPEITVLLGVLVDRGEISPICTFFDNRHDWESFKDHTALPSQIMACVGF